MGKKKIKAPEPQVEEEVSVASPDPRISDSLILDLNRLDLDEYQEFEDLLFEKGSTTRPSEMKQYVLKALGREDGDVGMLDFVRASKRFLDIYMWEMQERKN